MRLLLTLLVRDEEDILRANLEYHLGQGVDFVLATDNGSVDGTVRILEEYERLGVLRLIHEPRDDYSQARWVTRMARLACIDHDADWIINSDADEFWWTGSRRLNDILGASRAGALALQRGQLRTSALGPPRPSGQPGHDDLPSRAPRRAKGCKAPGRER